jgi:hypothetical protein
LILIACPQHAHSLAAAGSTLLPPRSGFIFSIDLLLSLLLPLLLPLLLSLLLSMPLSMLLSLLLSMLLPLLLPPFLIMLHGRAGVYSMLKHHAPWPCRRLQYAQEALWELR